MPPPQPQVPTRILVAVSGTEPSHRESSMKAAAYALNLAGTFSAKLLGVCVVQIPEYIEESTRAPLREELVSKSQATLTEIDGLASEKKVEFSWRVLETSGAIATAICNLASKEGIDLVILGTRGTTSSLTKMMLGSVALGVTNNADCPVLVVR